jgi:hypothetical protein
MAARRPRQGGPALRAGSLERDKHSHPWTGRPRPDWGRWIGSLDRMMRWPPPQVPARLGGREVEGDATCHAPVRPESLSSSILQPWLTRKATTSWSLISDNTA